MLWRGFPAIFSGKTLSSKRVSIVHGVKLSAKTFFEVRYDNRLTRMSVLRFRSDNHRHLTGVQENPLSRAMRNLQRRYGMEANRTGGDNIMAYKAAGKPLGVENGGVFLKRSDR